MGAHGRQTLQTLDARPCDMAPVHLLGSGGSLSTIISKYNLRNINVDQMTNHLGKSSALIITGLVLFYLIGVTILVVQQMKKVWITTDMDLLEDREINENNEEVKKKTVILEAEGDNKGYATFEQNITRNKIIF